MEEKLALAKPQRNYALDLLRIISMLMIVSWHILGHGNVVESAKSGPRYLLAFFLVLRVCCVVSVNLYVLISSYFLVNQKFRPSKMIHLYLEVLFWGALGYVAGIVLNGVKFSIKTLALGVFFPFSSKYYWFVSAYFVMYLLTPLLNFVIKKLTKRQHLAVMLGLLALFSLWRNIFPATNVFNLENGYSFEWFIVLYFVGSYLRLHADPKKWKLPGLWYFVTAIGLTAAHIAAALVSDRIGQKFGSLFLQYNSVFVVLEAVLLFVAFLKIEIKGKLPQKIIGFAAPLTFGVYLIHDNRFFRGFLWQNIVRTQDFPYNSLLVVPVAIGMILLVFLACLTLDFVRSLIFSLFEKRKFWRGWLEKFDNFVVGTLYKITDFILEGKKKKS